MKFISKQKGFTLVEMIVSLAVFTVVALIAVGALLKITDANKKSQTMKSVINNLNFALESMSREMRVGTVYDCVGNVDVIPITGNGQTISSNVCDITSGKWVIAFNTSKKGTNSNGQGSCSLIYEYSYSSTEQTIKKTEQKYCDDNINSADNFIPIISPEVKITSAQIKVKKSSANAQAYAWFHIKGNAGVKEKSKTYFDLQTSVSQRISD